MSDLETLKITIVKPTQEARTGMQLSDADNGTTFVEVLNESGLAFAGPSFSLGAHGAPVIAAAADPDTRWLLFTASRAGEAFVWDDSFAHEVLWADPSDGAEAQDEAARGVSAPPRIILLLTFLNPDQPGRPPVCS